MEGNAESVRSWGFLARIAAVIVALLTSACTRSAPASRASTSAPSTDVARLGRLMAWPAPPSEARWLVVAMGAHASSPGPDDWSLHALLRYPPATLRAIVAGASPAHSAIGPLPEWIPATLRVDAATASALDPAPFRRSPLLHGAMLPLGPEHLYVILYTM